MRVLTARRNLSLYQSLFAAAVLVAVIFGASCDLVFQLEGRDPPAPLFVGCYVGQVTDPPDGGKVRIIFESSGEGSGLVLSGCMESGAVLATFAASFEESSTQTVRVSAMSSGGGSFSFRATRQPAELVQATSMDLENLNGAPFNAVLGLPVCAAAEVATCADLGLPMAFAP